MIHDVIIILVVSIVFAHIVVWLDAKQIARWEKQGLVKCSCPCGFFKHWLKPKPEIK